MRFTSITFFLCLAAAAAVPAAEKGSHTITKEHPGDTALSERADGTYEYKSFPGLLTLYVFDGDMPGKSNCNAECISAWPPLLVSANETAKTVGDWAVIARKDGQRQWAYKGHPVYTRYHNIPPDESIEKEGFHVLKP